MTDKAKTKAERFLSQSCGGNYAVVPLHVAADPDLTASEVRLVNLLAVFALDGNTCWPSAELLCTMMSCSKRTLQRTRKSLREKRPDLLTYREGYNNHIRYEITRDAKGLPKEKRGLRKIKSLRKALGLPEREAPEVQSGPSPGDPGYGLTNDPSAHWAWIGTNFKISQSQYKHLSIRNYKRPLHEALKSIDQIMSDGGINPTRQSAVAVLREHYVS